MDFVLLYDQGKYFYQLLIISDNVRPYFCSNFLNNKQWIKYIKIHKVTFILGALLPIIYALCHIISEKRIECGDSRTGPTYFHNLRHILQINLNILIFY